MYVMSHPVSVFSESTNLVVDTKVMYHSYTEIKVLLVIDLEG